MGLGVSTDLGVHSSLGTAYRGCNLSGLVSWELKPQLPSSSELGDTWEGSRQMGEVRGS